MTVREDAIQQAMTAALFPQCLRQFSPNIVEEGPILERIRATGRELAELRQKLAAAEAGEAMAAGEVASLRMLQARSTSPQDVIHELEGLCRFVVEQETPATCGNNSGAAYWSELRRRLLTHIFVRLAARHSKG